MSTKLCSVETCNRNSITRGWCKAHYLRQYNTGNLRVDEPVGSIRSGGRPRGYIKSQSERDKISKAKLGVKRPDMMGVKNWSWKGGITKKTLKERKRFSTETRLLVFERDNYTCQVCDQYGGNLQVDHIKTWADYPELRFELDNCRTLCMACHYYITFKRKIPAGIIWGHNLSRGMH